MSLRMIVGRAGTGKTRLCMEEIASRLREGEKNPLILLVPEQATFYTEKALLECCKTGGIMNAQVFSFQRLAWRVLQDTGGGIYPFINDTGKALVLRNILEEHGENLRVFARVKDSPGFLENLVRMVGEFKAYGIKPETLTGCARQLDKPQQEDTRLKLEDLALIYGRFESYLANAYVDAEGALEKLANNIHRAGFLDRAEVWVDGFVGFTPQEYEIIKELLLKVKRVNLALCLDPQCLKKRLEETDLFYPPWETYERLLSLAGQINCEVEETVRLDYSGRNRFSSRRELAWLEESLIKETGPFEGEADRIKLVSAANRRAEVEALAREILFNCRERSLRFQDMAVLIPDFSHYETLLPAVFSDYGIPYFIDRKRKLGRHPLLDLLGGALEIALKGWNYEPVFRCLKTDLVPLSRQEADLLENYCLAFGIRHGRWTDGKPWTYFRDSWGKKGNGDGTAGAGETELLARVNKAREKVAPCFLRLEKACREGRTAFDYCLALFGLLEDLKVRDKLKRWSLQAEQEGRLEEARRHSQLWNKLAELFEQVAAVLGRQEMDLATFSRIFEAGLQNIELGQIPPCLDQVLVCSLDRSRTPEMKAVYVLGANEGVLPARMEEEGLLSDGERTLLAGLEVELAPTSEERLFSEQFLIYLAMTRASDYLWVSWPAADVDGKALSPSVLVKHFTKNFSRKDGGSIVTLAAAGPDGKNDRDLVVRPLPVLGYLAVCLRRLLDNKGTDPVWLTAYNWLVSSEEWKEPLGTVVRGLFEKNEEFRLPHALVRRLYGQKLSTGIYRLEKYRACPFSYFMDAGLRLKAREDYKLTPPELGNLFHAALEEVCKKAMARKKSLAALEEKELSLLVEDTVDTLAPQLQNELLLSTARYRYLTGRLKKIVGRAALVLREHEKRGVFRPLGMEISFGANGHIPGLQFVLSDGTVLSLEGRIDRLDWAADGKGGCFLRVIDYKSGELGLSLLEVFYGLKMQLLVYLDVVLKHAHCLVEGEAKPGGVLYFRIRDPFIPADYPLDREVVEKKILQELKMKGYVLKDSEAVRMMDGAINGYSELIPAGLSKEGEFYRNLDSLLSAGEFAALREHVRNLLQEIGEEIVSGNVTIQPWRFRGKSPCRFCLYQPVCRFEPALEWQRFRLLPDRKPEEAWAEIGLKGGREE